MELDLEIIVALGGLLVSGIIGIVGGVWFIESRFEKKLREVENRLQAEIKENRNLIINYIAKDKGGYIAKDQGEYIAEDKGKYNAKTKAKDKKYADLTQDTKGAQLKDST